MNTICDLLIGFYQMRYQTKGISKYFNFCLISGINLRWKFWAFYREIIKYIFLHKKKPNLSMRQSIYFSSIRIQTGVTVIVQSLEDIAIF